MTSTADDDGRPTTADDPIEEFARRYNAVLRAELATKTTTPTQADPRTARQWTAAAIGALNRRDLPTAVKAVRHVLLDQESTVCAIDYLSGILLAGFPQGGLRRGARITLDVATPPDDPLLLRATRLAADLITGIASGDDELAARGLHALRGPLGQDILLTLLRAASTRVERFVGIDGDTVDAYYAESHDHP